MGYKCGGAPSFPVSSNSAEGASRFPGCLPYAGCWPSETVVQPSSTAHFHYGFATVEPLPWYSNKLLSRNLKTAIFQPSKRCHTP